MEQKVTFHDDNMKCNLCNREYEGVSLCKINDSCVVNLEDIDDHTYTCFSLLCWKCSEKHKDTMKMCPLFIENAYIIGIDGTGKFDTSDELIMNSFFKDIGKVQYRWAPCNINEFTSEQEEFLNKNFIKLNISSFSTKELTDWHDKDEYEIMEVFITCICKNCDHKCIAYNYMGS